MYQIILALVVATFYDLKNQEIPDIIPIFLVFFGVIYNFINGEIIQAFLGSVLCFIIAMIMFYSKAWGGGDSKILIGLGTVIGLDFVKKPDLIVFLGLLILVGFAYVAIYELFIKKEKRPFMPAMLATYMIYLLI